MYRVKDSASVRDLSYSKLRGREVELEVILHRNRVCGVVVAKVIGAVWWHSRLFELICWYRDTIINASVSPGGVS